MRLCFVIQRYGLEVAGGSELHCRWLAGRLARHHQVEVATTCALDYLTWENHYPPGDSEVDGVPVTRYRVAKPRSTRRFSMIQDLVFHDEHSLEDERRWVEENGPRSPELVKSLRSRHGVDFFLFYCYRYYQTFFGLPTVADRAVLVPTAEEDPAIRLRIFGGLLRAPKGLIYLTPEERELVQGVSANDSLPDVVVGSGINVADGWEQIDARGRYHLPDRYLLYVGRIDSNKGADQLFAFYRRLADEWPQVPPLLLVGKAVLDIPNHPKIRYLGYLSEVEKFALLSRCEKLIMPSALESLSVIVLEAWAMGRPVLVNAACQVLEGQCVRSGGGLFYRGYSEFAEALRRLSGSQGLGSRLGVSGQAYVRREYDWDVVESRTNGLLEALHAANRLARTVAARTTP